MYVLGLITYRTRFSLLPTKLQCFPRVIFLQCPVSACLKKKNTMVFTKDFFSGKGLINYTKGLLRNWDVTIVVSELRLRLPELVGDGLLVCLVWCLCLDYSYWNC